MKKLTLTLLAGAALAMPAFVPATAQNTPQNQQPQAQQQNNNGQAGQPQGNQPDQSQNQPQANGSDQNQNQPQASNLSISPNQLGHNGVRQVQQALAKKGFHSGRADGIWGRDTRTALRNFQKSKGIQSSKGQLNQQTLSDLGVNVASNDQNQNNNQNGNNNSSPNQNQNQ